VPPEKFDIYWGRFYEQKNQIYSLQVFLSSLKYELIFNVKPVNGPFILLSTNY